jgi:hypothetical protein
MVAEINELIFERLESDFKLKLICLCKKKIGGAKAK